MHQVLAGAGPHDAITNHAVEMRMILRSAGYRSEIFADRRHLSADLLDLIHPHDAWDAVAQSDDRAILHYSIDSPAFGLAMQRAGRVGLVYHNVTPPDLLWRDAPGVALMCRDGQRMLHELAPRVDMAAADSVFNAGELEAAGAPPTRVLGILRPPRAFRDRTHVWQPGQRLRLLFVGRGIPNKRQYDLVLALAALTEGGVDAELRLVGSWGACRPYLERCRRLARELGVQDRVVFARAVSEEHLVEEYENAHVFICLSAHEGYCAPLIEAMEAGLPVVARRAGAVPETVGDAGVLIDDPRPSAAAAAVLDALRSGMGAVADDARARHLADHSHETVSRRILAFAEDLAGC